MKIVLNRAYGGYSLSNKACEFLGLPHRDNEDFFGDGENRGANYVFQDLNDRINPDLVRCVETLGNAANGTWAKLEVLEFPDEATDFYIQEYDGAETLLYVFNGKIYSE